LGPSAMDGRSKLGFIPDSGDGVIKPQGEGRGEEEGTTTHPIEDLAGLREAGKMVAGGGQCGGGTGAVLR
jgi:hypothetical protein